MNLKDFKPEELIGKKVRIDNRISTINRVTKKYFGIVGSNDLFELESGRLRGASVWHPTWANIISDEEAAKTIQDWKENREKRIMRENIVAILNRRDNDIAYDDICTITQLIFNNKK